MEIQWSATLKSSSAFKNIDYQVSSTEIFTQSSLELGSGQNLF